MALKFIDSFDHYDTGGITRKWNSLVDPVSIDAGAGRNGTQGLGFHGHGSKISKTFPAQQNWAVGFAAYFPSLGPGGATPILQWLDAGQQQVVLSVISDGTLVVQSNGAPLAGGTSVNALQDGAYYYIEFYVTISKSIPASHCLVNVNGTNWITVTTGQSTQATSNPSANSLQIGILTNSSTALGAWTMDDFYACDGTGAINNGFLGDVMIQPLYPNNIGGSTQWTPTGSSDNYANVNDLTADDETTFNQTSVASQSDYYAMDDLSSAPSSIKGIQWNAKLLKTDASTYLLHRIIYSGTTVFEGSVGYTPNTAYQYFTEILELDPNTASAWTFTTINAAQAGVKLVSVV